jgi:hypothetical protein
MVRVDRLYLGPMSAPDQLGSDKLKHNSKNNTEYALFYALLRAKTYILCSDYLGRKKRNPSRIKQKNPDNQRKKNSSAPYILCLEKGEQYNTQHTTQT